MEMISPKDWAHFEFINRTDRKSLYTQIKQLVKTAQDVAAKELEQRREELRSMLEREDLIYEEEFAKKVKSRIDEDIQQRKDALIKIKEKRRQKEQKFLAAKTVQQHFESCCELRDALRHKETLQTKDAQLEQMLDNQRAFRRQRQLDDYWCKVRDANTQRYDQRQAAENKVKCDLNRSMRCMLDEQVEMHNREEERLRELKHAEAKELDKLLEDLRLEEFDRMRQGVPEKTVAYRNQLLEMIANNKAKRDAEECERIADHRQLMRDVAREQREHSAAMLQRQRAVYNATMEYLEYARRMRDLEEKARQARNARIDDLRHVDICTKSNIQRELQRKAEIAALCYAELRRQICEEYERRLRDLAERSEQKIMENRFARPEKTRGETMAERFELRKALDAQVAENARIHAAQEAKYNAELKLAVNDSEFCKELAATYLREGIDYLPPHDNWLIYACPEKNYVSKQITAKAESNVKSDSYEKLCGCATRAGLECTHFNWSAVGRGAAAVRKRRELETC
ncbi:trichoplein keratin filament-binding protein-like [Ceratitis capitata]|uniref:trichoplein keratin filament-binding protein-like n=1 Tax=Ceratitis capitata TaxID=7213 RepID=UPI000618814C|nr:trichoplein keratin filament-binding protein-like [Ceratitis capitata]